MDAHTNVESLSFTFDSAQHNFADCFDSQFPDEIPIPIPIPNLNPLQPPLGAIPAPITNITMLKDTAKLSPMAAIGVGLAAAAFRRRRTGTGSLTMYALQAC